ncbi:putative pentatricopeptide repeat-containing protein At5g47460 [Carica papaya]|uniref:putative pentatricopeptide repeat-containing protein At5g47460 n=1 Tax=Carica papaya TaxID=3649 RepID=UPI000B8C9A3D|nr:putative pentatricopeptide repeat-containing protein At5g47460 [Carica papaya]
MHDCSAKLSLVKTVQRHLSKQKPFIRTKLFSPTNRVNRIPLSDFELWTKIISDLAQGATEPEIALHDASRMLNNGSKPNGYSLVQLIRVSTDLGYDSYCQLLHGYIIKSGFVSDVSVSNALLKSYKRFGSSKCAHKVFVEIPQPSVISWNSLISGYVQSGQFSKGLCLFLELGRSDICADAFSFSIALSACGQLNLLRLGQSIHSKILKCGLESGVVIANCLIDTYGKCGSVEEAISVFEYMINKDIISWNSVVAACAKNGELELAFCFFHRMPYRDIISYNQLISGIALFGNIDDAIQILSHVPNPNSSSWTSILTGYVNRNWAWDALGFFSTMHAEGVGMDEFTYSIILSGAAGLSALTWGVLIHCCTIKCGLETAVVVGSALIDMYSKCGQVKTAESMFQAMPRKNLITWNAMVSGYAHNGDSTKVIQLFEQIKMVRDLQPDSVTFLNVLAACSHDETLCQSGIQYFESMINEYRIEPTVEHCCTMIRLMGKGGEVFRAGRMINTLGFECCGVVWRALLGACGTSKDLKVAKIAAAKVIELEGDDEYVYVMMSNMYACYGKWREASLIRKLMRDRGMRKEAGCSWIEVENMIANSIQ